MINDHYRDCAVVCQGSQPDRIDYPRKPMHSQRRSRRSTDEIRARLIDAARELFENKGYEATTTRDICALSGVAQTQLFHNFGSKEGIFEAAFITPLVELVNRYITDFDNARRHSTIDENVAMLVNGLFDIASVNRSVLLTALCRRSMAPDPRAAPSDLLDHIARTLHEMEVIQKSPPGIDIPAAIVTTAGTVFGVVLLEEMLYPVGSPRLSRERLTTEMITTIMHGALHREGPESMGVPYTSSGGNGENPGRDQ
jgi:AcrR family transcriptional regulator